MKHLFLISGLCLCTMCTPQNKKIMAEQHSTTQTIEDYNSQDYLFHAEFNGGTQQQGFRILKTQSELDAMLGGNDFILKEEQSKSTDSKVVFPEHQTVILYNFGEFRSGDHTPKGIERIALVDGVLEVYLKKDPPSKFPDREMAIQVISTPYMVFSVPKTYEFKTIVIK